MVLNSCFLTFMLHMVCRALLFQTKLPPSFWSYDILHVVFLTNRVPTPVLNNQSPYFVLHNKLPNLNLFKVFICLCYASTLHSHRTKLQPRAIKSLFLGYKSGYKGFTLYDLYSREIFVSRHVTFHENFLPYHLTSSSTPPDWEYFSLSPSSDITTPIPTSHTPESPAIIDDIFLISHNLDPPSPPPLPVVPVIPRHSTRQTTTPSYLQDYICNNIHSSTYHIHHYISHHNLSNSSSSFVMSLHTTTEPKSYVEASKHDC